MSDRKATVEFGLGRTLNLGKFESVKIHVSLSMDCEPTKTDVSTAFDRAKQFVKEKLEEEVAEWLQ